MSTIKIGWYCSHYVSEPKWQTTEIFEPDTCDTVFETIESLEDWQNEDCEATCPKCGAPLSQTYNGPVEIT